jgi:hypothetical protein
VNLWLDDIRPAPRGWIWCKTVAEAQSILVTGLVEMASLDHDLDPRASAGGTPMIPTGYHLVLWMVQTGNWPKRKPNVHSANPWGAARMKKLIERCYSPW